MATMLAPLEQSNLTYGGVPLKRCPLKRYTLLERSYSPSHPDPGWRAPVEASERGSPRFFLVDGVGCNSSAERAVLRQVLKGRPIQRVLPIIISQYLIDLPLVDALEEHPLRTFSPEEADWFIVGAAPYSSEVLSRLELLGGRTGHLSRMRALAACLRRLSQRVVTKRSRMGHATKMKSLPLFVPIPTLNLQNTVGVDTLHELLAYNQNNAPVSLGIFDRSSAFSGGTNLRYLTLWNQSVVLPHIASPLLAKHARRTLNPAKAFWSVASPLRARLRRMAHSETRRGFVFHGDFGRFDAGARDAMRNLASYLRNPHTFVARGDMNRDTANSGVAVDQNASSLSKLPSIGPHGEGVPSSAHLLEQKAATNTSTSMLGASLCFAPQGDIMSSRRLFDALAAGCAPVVLKSIGDGPKEYLLGNLPFHHTVNWREVALFIAPRGIQRGESPGWKRNKACRIREAAWLDAWHDEPERLARLRRNGQAAFLASMDVEYNPRGVADALLQVTPIIHVPATLHTQPNDATHATPRATHIAPVGYGS